MTDIRVFKFKNGEEFIAQITNENEDHNVFDVLNPVIPTLNGFVPWCLADGSRKFKIKLDMLLWQPSEPDENVLAGYKQTFNLGVIAVQNAPVQLIKG